MSLSRASQPMLRVNTGTSVHESGSVSACCLGPDLIAALARTDKVPDLLQSVFRVNVAQEASRENDDLPSVSGRYYLYDDEVRFIPTFPFDTDVKYRGIFDARPLGFLLTKEPVIFDFVIPSNSGAFALTEVTHIFPSGGLLPENLLRFYVCFSNSMHRGRALKEIALLDADGRPVADALYRPPVELWDRSMRRLTVLLDPGRLKRSVGPNLELGPPLQVGKRYTLEIGPGMTDQYGRAIREPVRKHFLAGDAVRGHISVQSWKLLRPAKGTKEPVELVFPGPLDWALLSRTVTVESARGSVINGRVTIDQCEKRWNFMPDSPWMAGEYRICVGPTLEDICGNNAAGAFDRPLRKEGHQGPEGGDRYLSFQLV